jgi:hypothetical protein
MSTIALFCPAFFHLLVKSLCVVYLLFRLLAPQYPRFLGFTYSEGLAHLSGQAFSRERLLKCDRMKYWGKIGAFWGGFWGLLFR